METGNAAARRLASADLHPAKSSHVNILSLVPFPPVRRCRSSELSSRVYLHTSHDSLPLNDAYRGSRRGPGAQLAGGADQGLSGDADWAEGEGGEDGGGSSGAERDVAGPRQRLGGAGRRRASSGGGGGRGGQRRELSGPGLPLPPDHAVSRAQRMASLSSSLVQVGWGRGGGGAGCSDRRGG